MKIPKKFNLVGQTITVEWKDTMMNCEDAEGRFLPMLNKIEIQNSVKGCSKNEEQLGYVFCHELTHAILDSMGETKLYHNEKFVDLFGRILHQVINSMEYETNKKKNIM